VNIVKPRNNRRKKAIHPPIFNNVFVAFYEDKD
jgi:hypothetical protein